MRRRLLPRAQATLSDDDQLALVTPFLRQTQTVNNKALNECLNQLAIREEDYESLRASIEEWLITTKHLPYNNLKQFLQKPKI